MTPSNPEQKTFERRSSHDGNRLKGGHFALCGLISIYFSYQPSYAITGRFPNLFLLGVYALLYGGLLIAAGLIRRGIARSKRAKFPSSPWLFDRAWNPRGTTEPISLRIGGCIAWAIASFVYSLTIFYGDSWDPSLIAQLPAWLSCFIGLLCLVFAGHLIHHFLHRGEMFLRFEIFPFRLGEVMEATLLYPKLLCENDEIEIVLRCVKEREGTYRYYGKHKGTVICEILFEETLRFEKGKNYRETDLSVPIQFGLPEEGTPTSLMKRPVVYWEILINYGEIDEDDNNLPEGLFVPVY